MAKIHISDKNSKLGRIPNISLTPGITCSPEACKTCLKGGCYALKAYRQYKRTRTAWDENTELALHDIAGMETQLLAYFNGMNAPRFFQDPCWRRLCKLRICPNVGRYRDNVPEYEFPCFYQTTRHYPRN